MVLLHDMNRKKPKGKLMSTTTRKANTSKSKIRSNIEHIFAEQKERMDLFIRTIGSTERTTKIGLANLIYNLRRLMWLEANLIPV